MEHRLRSVRLEIDHRAEKTNRGEVLFIWPSELNHGNDAGKGNKRRILNRTVGGVKFAAFMQDMG